MLRPINTVSDLLDYVQQYGAVERSVLEASGLGSLHAVAAELRRRGYLVTIPLSEDRIYVDATPTEMASLREGDQVSLFDQAPPTHVPRHGWGDDPE